MKEQIRESATELFLNLGFKAVTMDDIAQQMAISKKTIYSHYSNKTALVEDSVAHLFQGICCGIDHILEYEKNPIEELYDIKKYVIQHLKGEKSSPIQQLHKYYPQVHAQLLKRQFEYMQDCMLKNINRGIKDGLFRDNLDIEFVSRIYFIGMTGIKDQNLFPTDKFPSAELHEQYLEYHLRGIVTPKGRSVLNQIIHSNQE
ncbi:TetR/AcrR family transcriptional regulator [Croceiramulus getboli]|nr:TetR/AcrR family transcriptional regulator [Flavobacteriaceae bacterium YJPT1-3]